MSGVEVLATLPDGSVATRQRIDHRTSIIGREVGGACVWGQAFSADDHEQQVADLVARMVANPGALDDCTCTHAEATAARVVERHYRAQRTDALMWVTEAEVSAIAPTTRPQVLLGRHVLVIDRPPT